MQLTKREMNMTRLLVQLATVVGLGVFFAATGPFGTYSDLGVGARYAYWVGLVLAGYVNIVIAAHAVAALWPRLGHAWRIALVTLVSTVPTVFAVAWAESVMRLSKPVSPVVMPRVFVSVAAIQLVVLLFLTRLQSSWAPLLFTRSPAPLPPEEPAAPAAQPATAEQAGQPFLRRLPVHLGTDLLALQAEDHYLRVVTTEGSDLILMRIADALNELDEARGLQVHRSWWVAHDAVSGIRRDGARTTLVLSNGQEVPVSRTYLAAVRAARWPRLEA